MDKIYTKDGEYVDKLGNPVYTGVCYSHPLRTPYIIYYDEEIKFRITKREYQEYKDEVVVFRLIRPENVDGILKDRFIICSAKPTKYIPDKLWIFNRHVGEIYFEIIEVLSDNYID